MARRPCASPLQNSDRSRRRRADLAEVFDQRCARESTRRSSWHTFRHTFSTLLIANGENVKVVQELMRHASSRCTLEVYSQAKIMAKRQAQQRVVQMILPEESDAPRPAVHGDGSLPESP